MLALFVFLFLHYSADGLRFNRASTTGDAARVKRAAAASQAAHGNPNVIPQFAPFYWNQTDEHGANLSYIINGTNCINLIYQGQRLFAPFCLPTALVVDPQKQRMLFDFGAAGGQFYMLQGAWYNANDAFIPGGQCARISPGSYPLQILGYTMVTAKRESTWQRAEYSGLAQDVGSCLEPYALISTNIVQQFGIVTDWFYSQLGNVPLGPNGSFICANTEAELTYNFLTLNRDPAAIEAMFVAMPSTCVPTTPYNYCTILYGPNATVNPCSQYNSVITIS
jgi:hypothetical protein